MQLGNIFRRYLGWCPQGSQAKTRTYAYGGNDARMEKPVPDKPAAPVPVDPAMTDHRTEYQTNLLLILLFLGGLFYAQSLNLLVPFAIVSAALVYFDAENIRAGHAFTEVSLLGEVATWRPVVWAVAVFIGSFVLFAIYLFCRKEIFTANN